MAVADAGGLSAAQGRIGSSLSRISQVLNEFEKRFGVKHCEHGRSGVALTETGEHIDASAADLRIAAHEGDASHPEFLLPQAIRLSIDPQIALRTPPPSGAQSCGR